MKETTHRSGASSEPPSRPRASVGREPFSTALVGKADAAWVKAPSIAVSPTGTAEPASRGR